MFHGVNSVKVAKMVNSENIYHSRAAMFVFLRQLRSGTIHYSMQFDV
jgi:hypothetical protein